MGIPWWGWVLTTVIGAVSVGWAITKAYATHDWRTCQCVDCRKRRYHAHKAQGHTATGVTPDGDLIWTEAPEPTAGQGPGAFISTADLAPRMVVILHGVPHRVTEINSDIKGYLVGLNPMGGPSRGKAIVASVRWANGNRKYWKIR